MFFQKQGVSQETSSGGLALARWGEGGSLKWGWWFGGVIPVWTSTTFY